MRNLIIPAAAAILASCASVQERPNVLIVLADDQGYGDLSCHGNPVLETPNIDAMHSRAVRMTDFHVAPVSTPTRGELLTGQDAMCNGAWSWGYGREGIAPDVTTMVDLFAEAGYATGHFGKWHLGDNFPFRPQEQGFEETITFGSAATHQTSDYWQNDNYDDHYRLKDGSMKQFMGYCTDVWFDLSMDFMGRCKQEQKPFFLFLPTNAAHSPHYVEDKYIEPFRAGSKSEDMAAFFGMLSNLDENMGRMERYMRDNDLFDNTIVIYFTDNGGTAGVKLYNAGMRGGKGSFYDGGHRGICFLQWPAGGLLEGYDLNNVTQVQDLYPTLLEFCGIEAPEAVRADLDGVSLASLMRSKDATIDDRKLIVQYSTKPEPEYGAAAVLWNQWRLVNDKELYDIKKDPAQTKNVAKKNPEVLKAMREHYAAWWAEAKPRADEFHPIVVGDDAENPMKISCFDWLDRTSKSNVTQQLTLYRGEKVNGTWYLAAAKTGNYKISLRRYPEEADFAIAGAYPAKEYHLTSMKECTALPIVKAKVEVDGKVYQCAVGKDDKVVTIEAPISAGEFKLKSYFYDAKGEELCGAYYVDVELL